MIPPCILIYLNRLSIWWQKELKLDLIIVGEAHNGKELVRVYKEKSAAGKVDIF